MRLRAKDFFGKTWFESILLCVEDIGKVFFSLQEVYEYEPTLADAYGANHHIQSKIRQTLQYLRKAEIIQFVDDNGNYKFVAHEFLPTEDVDYTEFEVTQYPLPNYPLSEVGEMGQQNFELKTGRQYALEQLRNLKIGDAGEQVILSREREVLKQYGRMDLAEKIEQVSKTKGDHVGYDILSFSLSGEEKWIEVKTTVGSQSAKFHISENQVLASENNSGNYQLHRLFDFNLKKRTSGLYIVVGNLRSQLNLTPTTYLAFLGA